MSQVADPNRPGVAPIAGGPAAAQPVRGVPARGLGPLLRLGADSPRHTPLAVLLVLAMIPLFGALALDERRLNGIDVWIKPPKFLAQATSNSPAAPIPPAMHIVTTTNFTPRRLPSISACPTSRAPDMPNG